MRRLAILMLTLLLSSACISIGAKDDKITCRSIGAATCEVVRTADGQTTVKGNSGTLSKEGSSLFGKVVGALLDVGIAVFGVARAVSP
jgi:hypothetical protein